MPIRPHSQPARHPPVKQHVSKAERFKVAEGRVNGGMVTQYDAADIENNQFQVAKNVRIRYDKTSRRAGTVILSPGRPNGNPVLAIALTKLGDGTPHTVRFTRGSVHIKSSGGWIQLTGTLNGLAADRIRTTFVLDKLLFTNHGADPIQAIDFPTASFATLGNAPNYRYVTGFYERAVGAAMRNVNEILVGWSGQGFDGLREWDSLVDISAGSEPLIESPGDTSDYITGIHGMTNVMAILRERSIWLATKNPIATKPFNFFAAVPEIGCDAPDTSVVIPGGICWLDVRTGTVYAYPIGGQPEPIGRAVESSIISGVTDPTTCFASYSPQPGEYTVCIPQSDGVTVAVWTHNFKTKTWVYDEIENITSASDIAISDGGVTIDDLGDTAIDDLEGTIDDLSPIVVTPVTRLYGKDNGDIISEDASAVTDSANESTLVGGDPFQLEIVSKVYTLPRVDAYFADVRADFTPQSTGTVKLWYSRSGGEEDDWVLAKTKVILEEDIGKAKYIRKSKLVRCRRFAWKLTSEDAKLDVIAFEVWGESAGKSTK